MKRESHLFAQETKLISEFWNLKKRIPTSTSRKVNLHVSIPHSWQYNSLTQKTPKKQVQHGWTVSSKIIWQNKNNQCLIMKGHWALIELKFKLFAICYNKRAFWLCIITQQNSGLLMWWLPLPLLHLSSQWLTVSVHIVNTKSDNTPLPCRTKGKIHCLFWNLNEPFCSGERCFEHVYSE